MTRVALYLRVSTARQAEQNLSIPDQRRQGEAYCQAKGWAIAAEYLEPGASATDDNREALQRMIEDARRPDRPFDVVLVHSFSRLFRDVVLMGTYTRMLEKKGVRVVSMTQETSDDADGKLVRTILAGVDWHSSLENAKHTLRAMKENARQGFWNGSPPPLGYKTYAAEQRGDRIKKRLEVKEAEAQIVRRIFELYRFGDGQGSGPMGVKAIASYLNEKGFRQRSGSRFATNTVHQILTRTAYTGRHFYNQIEAKTKQQKPKGEWIEVETPQIIEPQIFDEVQQLLAERNPKKTPPRIVNGPTLLTGTATCATCGGGMMLRTGKSGRYRYYTCATAARQGKTACPGRSVPMDRLDDLVIDHLIEKLFTVERLTELLKSLMDRTITERDRIEATLRDLKRHLRETEQQGEKLLDLALSVGNSPTVQDRIRDVDRRKEETLRQIAMTKRQLDVPTKLLSPRKLEAFAHAMRQRLKDGNVQFRKSYLKLFVDSVEVDDEQIRISGSTATLARAAQSAKELDAKGVPTLVREWRPLPDSNRCCRRERASPAFFIRGILPFLQRLIPHDFLLSTGSSAFL